MARFTRSEVVVREPATQGVLDPTGIVKDPVTGIEYPVKPDDFAKVVRALMNNTGLPTYITEDRRKSGAQQQAQGKAPTVAAPEEKQRARQRLESEGITPIAGPGGFKTSQQVIEFLDLAGIDTSDPALRLVLADPGFVDIMNGPSAEGYMAGLKKQFPKRAITVYEQARQELGFQGPFPHPDPHVSPEITRIEGYKVRDYEISAENGAIRFRNGVIVDPSIGPEGVTFPDNENVPGSPVWLTRAQQTWDKPQILQQRQELYEMGYLPKDAVDRPVFDVQLRDTLEMFHRYRYLNLGKPVPLGPPQGDTGGDTLDFGELRASIENDVTGHFREVFGDDPSDAEKKRWTDFVVNTAMKLQSRDLDAGVAGTEARARFQQRLEQHPVAVFERETEEENTELRDSLLRAVLAVRGLE
jgi:hypothetical protein